MAADGPDITGFNHQAGAQLVLDIEEILEHVLVADVRVEKPSPGVRKIEERSGRSEEVLHRNGREAFSTFSVGDFGGIEDPSS
jgi:hypothetical protein